MTEAPPAEWTWTPERLQAATDRMEEYRGTPHIHRRAKPGNGVDCVHLVYEALVAAGLVEAIRLPGYRRNDGFAQKRNYMEQHFLFAFHGTSVPGTEPPEEGDLVVFQIHRSVNHCGIFLGGEIWHSAYGRGAYPEPVEQTSHGAQCWIRITGAGYHNDPKTDPAVKQTRRN